MDMEFLAEKIDDLIGSGSEESMQRSRKIAEKWLKEWDRSLCASNEFLELVQKLYE